MDTVEGSLEINNRTKSGVFALYNFFNFLTESKDQIDSGAFRNKFSLLDAAFFSDDFKGSLKQSKSK